MVSFNMIERGVPVMSTATLARLLVSKDY